MIHKNKVISDHSNGADYTILLKRLGKMVIENNENEKCNTVLRKKDIWDKLSQGQALEWAGLAQITGQVDTALEIYEFLVSRLPDLEPAWKEYIELIDILDRKSFLVSVVKRAKKNLSEDLVNSWLRRTDKGGTTRFQKDFKSLSDPFVEMQTRQKLLANYLSLFSGRSDVFAAQWADRKTGKSGYVPVRRPMGMADLEDHLKGLKTYGFYLMDKKADVRCGVIDADLFPEFRENQKDGRIISQLKKEQSYMISRIREASEMLELNQLVEVSGYKGLHFWYFMDRAVAASLVRQALLGITQSLKPDLRFFDLEVFPKQDHLKGKGFGNLVKFPLGVHRLSGKRSFFSACLKKDITSQLVYLANVKKSPAEAVKAAPIKTASRNLLFHPKMEAISKKYPGLFDLERCCPAIGHIIATAREKKPLSAREEKILFQTIGFLPDARKIIHYLMSMGTEYNPHMVDYKLSRLRGTPLGCRRIHSLTGFVRDYCDIEPDTTGYLHPLIHLEIWQKMSEKKTAKCRKIENLNDALENLKTAIIQVEKFIS
ncbi:CRISPR-associated primase-polymerase type A1 [Desulfobacula sp.]